MRYERPRIVEVSVTENASLPDFVSVLVPQLAPYLLWRGNSLRCLFPECYLELLGQENFLDEFSWCLRNPLVFTGWWVHDLHSVEDLVVPVDVLGQAVQLGYPVVSSDGRSFNTLVIQAQCAIFARARLLPLASSETLIAAFYLAGFLSPQLAPIAAIVARDFIVEDLPTPEDATMWVYRASEQFAPAEVRKYQVSRAWAIMRADSPDPLRRFCYVVVDLEPLGETEIVDAALGCVAESWETYSFFKRLVKTNAWLGTEAPLRSAFPVLSVIVLGKDDATGWTIVQVGRLIRPWGSLIGQLVDGGDAKCFLGVSAPPGLHICYLKTKHWREFYTRPIGPLLNVAYEVTRTERFFGELVPATVDQVRRVGPSTDVAVVRVLEQMSDPCSWLSVAVVHSEIYGAVPLRHNYYLDTLYHRGECF